MSIVVPCYNCAEFVLLAFESFERSFDILHDLVLRLGTRCVSLAPPNKVAMHSVVVALTPTRYAYGRPIECEVVVVDDKSADNSVALISRFLDPSGVWAGKACAECKHPPPKYTLLQHSVNQGAGVTRNDGVAAAHGQVILFGESDDVFYEHHAAVCWDMMRRYPNLAFIKMRMDAGKEYVESSFIAHQAPVQTLHPHWQVAIEDTSPMNLCVRKDAHNFIGGYPDGELFHMDMEVLLRTDGLLY